MSVSRALSALMQAVAVEGPGADGPALFHTSAGSSARGLLPRAENAPAASRHQPCDRAAVSGDDALSSGLDVANTPGECLVRLVRLIVLLMRGSLCNKRPAT